MAATYTVYAIHVSGVAEAIYIGCTARFEKRCAEHRRGVNPFVADFLERGGPLEFRIISEHKTFVIAHGEEGRLIRLHSPICNTTGTGLPNEKAYAPAKGPRRYASGKDVYERYLRPMSDPSERQGCR